MKRAGFTLIEVLFATIILAAGLVTLMSGITNCARMMTLAKEFQDAQFVFSLGERCFPIPPNEEISDPEEDERLNIDPISAEEMLYELELDLPRETRKLYEGYTFERWVEEKDLGLDEQDDGLYMLRTRIVWGDGGPGCNEELMRLIRKKK